MDEERVEALRTIYKGDNETRITRANSPETACIFCMIRDVI